MKKGFTLIELLVVIAIIALLASVVISSLNSARAKARDTKRVADMQAIKTALELYYNKYGYYPAWNQTSIGRDCSGYRGTSQSGNTFMQLLVTEGFLTVNPQDPLGTNCRFQYRDEKFGQAFRILFMYEKRTNNDLQCYQPGGWSCVRVNFDDLIE